MIRRGIGVQSYVSAGGGTDADAQAFITAAGITDATQQSAINTLVTDLKGYGIWSKMKAIYPFVGGTSSTHKWNLKDPRDLDTAFRLVFSGGGTHASTGWTPNGINGYGDSKLLQNSLDNNSVHLSMYSRSNTSVNSFDIGGNSGSPNFQGAQLTAYYTSIGAISHLHGYPTDSAVSSSFTDTRAFYLGSRTSSTSNKLYRNSSLLTTNTTARTSTLPSVNFRLASDGIGFTNREFAFASIGDGLTDTEAANLYTAVQAYQTTLGRSVGTQTVSDADAQAFVNAAVIEDQVQATAINTLVTDLKGYGIWSKMKAIYPFVGGTSSTHKFNLKDPRDLDAAYRLVFSGGWTHSNTGATPNGTNGYADSKCSQLDAGGYNDMHLSFYSRTNNSDSTVRVEMGRGNTVDVSYTNIYTRLSNSLNKLGGRIGSKFIEVANTDGRCFVSTSATSSTSQKLYKNGVSVGSNINTQTGTASNTLTIYIGSQSYGGSATEYANNEYAFASIGNGLTDTEAANLYTAVQAYQTSLNRQV